MLSYTQNPDFVGRGNILKQLQNELVITGEYPKRAVLWGLGGVGSIYTIFSRLFYTTNRVLGSPR
jgi:hypothetical protein